MMAATSPLGSVSETESEASSLRKASVERRSRLSVVRRGCECEIGVVLRSSSSFPSATALTKESLKWLPALVTDFDQSRQEFVVWVKGEPVYPLRLVALDRIRLPFDGTLKRIPKSIVSKRTLCRELIPLEFEAKHGSSRRRKGPEFESDLRQWCFDSRSGLDCIRRHVMDKYPSKVVFWNVNDSGDCFLAVARKSAIAKIKGRLLGTVSRLFKEHKRQEKRQSKSAVSLDSCDSDNGNCTTNEKILKSRSESPMRSFKEPKPLSARKYRRRKDGSKMKSCGKAARGLDTIARVKSSPLTKITDTQRILLPKDSPKKRSLTVVSYLKEEECDEMALSDMVLTSATDTELDSLGTSSECSEVPLPFMAPRAIASDSDDAMEAAVSPSLSLTLSADDNDSAQQFTDDCDLEEDGRDKDKMAASSWRAKVRKVRANIRKVIEDWHEIHQFSDELLAKSQSLTRDVDCRKHALESELLVSAQQSDAGSGVPPLSATSASDLSKQTNAEEIEALERRRTEQLKAYRKWIGCLSTLQLDSVKSAQTAHKLATDLQTESESESAARQLCRAEVEKMDLEMAALKKRRAAKLREEASLKQVADALKSQMGALATDCSALSQENVAPLCTALIATLERRKDALHSAKHKIEALRRRAADVLRDAEIAAQIESEVAEMDSMALSSLTDSGNDSAEHWDDCSVADGSWKHWSNGRVLQWLRGIENGRFAAKTSLLENVRRSKISGRELRSLSDLLLRTLDVSRESDRSRILECAKALTRASALKKKRRKSKRKKEASSSGTPATGRDADGDWKECVICHAEKVSIVCVPCGHLCVCGTCCGHWSKDNGTCPFCRRPVTSFIRCFSVGV